MLEVMMMTLPGPSIPIRVKPITPAIDPSTEPMPDRQRPGRDARRTGVFLGRVTATPDLAEHVIGYRAWRLRRDGRLVSVARPSTWTAVVNEAPRALAIGPSAPDQRSRCRHDE